MAGLDSSWEVPPGDGGTVLEEETNGGTAGFSAPFVLGPLDEGV